MTVRYAPELSAGTVTLVGGGPGDPGLLTLAGLEAVRQADVILYDRLAPVEVLDEAPGHCEKLPVGKVPRGEYVPQERINALLVEHAQAGRKVVRLKGGDSFVFGRGEEWQACAAAGVPVRVVPGVTSAVAAPELVGIPVTHRHLVQGFTVVSGHVAPDDPHSMLDWAQLATSPTTLVRGPDRRDRRAAAGRWDEPRDPGRGGPQRLPGHPADLPVPARHGRRRHRGRGDQAARDHGHR